MTTRGEVGGPAGGGAGPSAWSDAASAAALFALDPAGCGPSGLVVRASAGPVRDRLLALLTSLLPPGAPMRRIGADIDATRLDGGLDLAATLAAGRPVAAEGVLAAAAGGVLVLAMAERLSGGTAARIAAALDGEGCRDERWVAAGRCFGVVALDEGIEPDERVPVALADRLGLAIDLACVPIGSAVTPPGLAAAVAAARLRLAAVEAGEAEVTALCSVAAAFGIASLRAPLQALAVARAAAALAGRDAVAAEDVTLAARLVLAPRAVQYPAPPDAEPPQQEDDPADQPPADQAEAETPPPSDDREDDDAAADQPLADVVIEAVRAALPPDLLAALMSAAGTPRQSRSEGRSGAAAKGGRRGRPVGVRRADPRSGDRISAYQTIRAAAPWQRLRRAEAAARVDAVIGDTANGDTANGDTANGDTANGDTANGDTANGGTAIGGTAIGEAANGGTANGAADGQSAVAVPRLIVRRDDFRAVRYEQRTGTTTIFVVDASGSAALNRLGEAKGAAELLLADCYVRRDTVALIAFRGREAELLLPPTGSLTRAKRSLAGLPGGGGTPLAAGLDAAVLLADQVRRRGDTPVLVVLTDGGANIGRDGTAGRAQAREDAEASARVVRAGGLAALLVDTAPRPDARARALAETMRATYLPLPAGRPETLARAVRGAAAVR